MKQKNNQERNKYNKLYSSVFRANEVTAVKYFMIIDYHYKFVSNKLLFKKLF